VISPFQMLAMVIGQGFGHQQLERSPEPSGTTDATENILQYDRVMSTKLAIAYAAGLTLVHRARPDGITSNAIDLACGPGHYTLCLAKYLGYQRVLGVDLSSGMVQKATENAMEQGLQPRVTFCQGDATRLVDIPSAEFNLASFTDAAHHMPDLNSVTLVLREMERITKPGGMIMVMDLVRLRTASLTERYVKVLGHDYVARGLPDFFEDFKNSMYAAWTPSEIASAVPPETQRQWWHIVPRPLPTLQVILGLPVGRERPILRGGVPWARGEGPVSRENHGEWAMLRATLKFASKHRVAARMAK
jgi:ubiquinone/menaquinone biosynthesis C-methylase UbiE